MGWRWFGVEVVWDGGGMEWRWYGMEVVWNGGGMEWRWCGMEVVWNVVDVVWIEIALCGGNLPPMLYLLTSHHNTLTSSHPHLHPYHIIIPLHHHILTYTLMSSHLTYPYIIASSLYLTSSHPTPHFTSHHHILHLTLPHIITSYTSLYLT